MAVKKKKGPLILGFQDKFAKKLPNNYVDTVNAMSEDDMKQAVLNCAKEMDATEKDMEDDDTLKNAKENVKVLSGGYRDVLLREKAMTKYLVFAMKDRGYA